MNNKAPCGCQLAEKYSIITTQISNFDNMSEFYCVCVCVCACVCVCI